MSIPQLPNPASAAAIIPELVKVTDRILSAYETGKRLDFEIAALDANYKLGKQTLEIYKEDLHNQHKETMQQLANQKRILISLLKQSQKNTENFLATQKHWRQQSDRICEAILKGKTSSEHRNELLELYRFVAQELDAGAKNYISNDQVTMKCIQNCLEKQIPGNNNRQLER